MAEVILITDPATPRFVYVSGADNHPVPTAVRELLKSSTYRADFIKDRQPPGWRIPSAAAQHLAARLEADGWTLERQHQQHGAATRASTGMLECPHPDCRRPRRARDGAYCGHCGHPGEPVSPPHVSEASSDTTGPCPACGMTTLPGVPHCTRCQSTRPSSANYCRECGDRLCRAPWTNATASLLQEIGQPNTPDPARDPQARPPARP